MWRRLVCFEVDLRKKRRGRGRRRRCRCELLFSLLSLPLFLPVFSDRCGRTHLGDLDRDLDLDLDRRRRCPRSSPSSLSSLVRRPLRRWSPSSPPPRSSWSSLRLPPPSPPLLPPRSPPRSRLRLRDRLRKRSFPSSRAGDELPRDRPLAAFLESSASEGGSGGGGGREGSPSPLSEVMATREGERYKRYALVCACVARERER